ncbi:hypothetical protein PR202_gb03514 [Eleusine coracana subsp. coracana]|uniref:Uncharacterized protein n=1 Tax=Eleusine coracana subsp. coracana TaxID=191504 RepID=A0AAV5E211_ELECO|nr:hypothetical protein PR202_gb03514 [Eleusine coracana subsp. coracana]
MEEYLENMKFLRSYMNDLEEDAAKRSAEEQQQRTAIDAHDAKIALGLVVVVVHSSFGDGTFVSVHRAMMFVFVPRWGWEQ